MVLKSKTQLICKAMEASVRVFSFKKQFMINTFALLVLVYVLKAKLCEPDPQPKAPKCPPVPPSVIKVESIPRTIVPQRLTFTKEYEKARRKARESLHDSWLAFKSDYKSMVPDIKTKKKSPWYWPFSSNSEDSDLKYLEKEEQLRVKEKEESTKRLYSTFRERYIETMASMDKMRENDGLDLARRTEAEALIKLVQDRLWASQNPKDCSRAKILVCAKKEKKAFWIRGNEPFCGWGCMMHHAIQCFMSAYGSSRVLLLDQTFYRMERHYLPLSETCQHILDNVTTQSAIPHWPPADPETPIVQVEPYNWKDPGIYRETLVPYLPADIADRIIRLSPDPVVWFVGQFARFLMRPNAHFQEALDSMPGSVQAGIHVRRTDKWYENDYVDTDMYLDVVQERFDIQDAKVGTGETKTLFVASDEPDVIKEIQRKRPNYKILSNASYASSANWLITRYSDASVEAIISDVHMLARSDFLACTLSSNVCRLAYELRTATRSLVADSTEVQTLDEQWVLHPRMNPMKYYQADHDRKAPPPPNLDGLNFKRGDIVVADNYPPHPESGYSFANHQWGSFVLSSLRRLYQVSDKFPKFL